MKRERSLARLTRMRCNMALAQVRCGFRASREPIDILFLTKLVALLLEAENPTRYGSSFPSQMGNPQPIALVGERLAIGLRSRTADQDVFVLLSTRLKGQNKTQFGKILYEIKGGVRWIILGVLMVLASALFATHRALSPLKTLPYQADKVGPDTEIQRPTTDRVPTEIDL